MAKMSEQTLQEFKEKVYEMATIMHENGQPLEEAFEFVFKQAHIRGEWAERNGIIE
ncbi:hypothetical protein [Paenibacillus sp. L3-i20]|uniref:hypothetical protein n=1 Tax=Paenibacillus sp. L3-i20 TaxID=2905833 RepID=UPI001EDF2158|nr:hypothetical protein [Paenibacillus sp. L3-i20]GKU79272.1 hypothetical protein L3i20_v236690 [Paenibacillus sp. L3-i20]